MLGIINPIAFRIFGFGIYWYAILIVTGILLAVWLAQKEAVKQGLKADDILDFIMVALPVAIAGARVYYVIFDWQYFIENPLSIFAIRQGGLAIYGGLIAGFGWLMVFTYLKVIPRLKFLDIATPSVLVGQIFGRWGNFVNQEAHGAETTRQFLKETLHLPNFIVEQMKIDGVYYQPTFLYESVWCLIGFIILMVVRHKKWVATGQLFAFYLFWYGIGRFVIEGMRTDSLMLGDVIRVSQLLSLILVFVGIGLFIYLNRKRRLNVKSA